MTIVATEAWCTHAGVESLTGVEAGAAVLAGAMVGAVVKILIAEQTSPALVADAVPWLVAGAVHAARIKCTLIAQRSLPAILTAASRSNKIKTISFMLIYIEFN